MEPNEEPKTPPPIPQQQPAYQPTPMGQDAGTRMLLPVGRSGWAIASGYLGLFSLIGIGAPFALITGIIAVCHIRKSRDSENPKHGMGRAIFGIVAGGLVTLLIAVVVILGAIE